MKATITLVPTLLSMLFIMFAAAQDITKLGIVYKISDMDKVQVWRGIVYKTVGAMNLTMDVYSPPDVKASKNLPAVILVLGFPDISLPTKMKDWEVYKSWAKLIAASGMIAISYETSQPQPDIEDLMSYVVKNASTLGIDADKIGIWSCSGNVPTALTVLSAERRNFIRCAVLYYGLMLTPDQKYADTIKAVAKQVKFSVEGLEKIGFLHSDLPLFIVRAGKDREDFNTGVDYFVAQALASNVPLTLFNYAEGHHAFDIYDDNDTSREIIKKTLEFLRFNLLGPPQS